MIQPENCCLPNCITRSNIITPVSEECSNIQLCVSLCEKETLEEIGARFKEHMHSQGFGVKSLTVTYMCNVCGKKDLLEEDVKRELCVGCKYVYDYCVDHPDPTLCPLCNTQRELCSRE